MAAFSSFQYHPFLVDSPFFPNNAHMNTPSSSTSSQFHHLPQSQPLVHHHHDTFFNETTSCCVDQSSKFTMSDNELSSVTKNQSPDTSLVVDNHNKLEPGEQVTRKATLNNPVENNNKKRRNRKASFLSPPQSKEDASSGERNKKQRKRMSSNDNNKSEEKELGDNKQKEAEKKKKKNQKKCGEEPPTGYIHVRARRGQATDSHSLAERVRREKISERMKMLQRLVPGCDKVTGKALMLDEIINYVQSLQNQVEFLSMKLASVNPIFYDFTMDMDTPTPMVRSEKSNCIASPVPLALVPQCSPNQVTAFPTANNDSYLLDNSALVSFLQGQRSNVLFSEDAGSQFWDVEDQRQKLFHPYGITNNTLCSFH